MKTAIWWIRRDLRLSDNQALTTALEQSGQVLPVFVLDQELLRSAAAGEKRLDFLTRGLKTLDRSLQQAGNGLVLRSGDPVEVLANLQRESGAEIIYAEADVSPYARRRDQRAAQNLPIRFMPGLTVHAPDAIHKSDGTPYTVFTPFSRAWLAQPSPAKPLPAPTRIPAFPGVESDSLPALEQPDGPSPFPAGEDEAQLRLETFIENDLADYAQTRNRVDLDGTSGLSPYLHFGMLSARQAVWAARQAQARSESGEARSSVETWMNELIWREFYISILHHFPFVQKKAFRPAFRDLQWADDAQGFSAWAQGQTGYPIVDAGMRQLLQTGWMHNRARMITASFLTKDLLIDWRRGERFFMQHLVDADLAANNGGWQWSAGTGTDAAPYFRIFNPILQSMKFDPDGVYIRRFVPELINVPVKFIHAPWEMPAEVQAQAGCRIGRDYPAPIVDHKMARQRVLTVYRS